jgi:hypothetical protein
MRLTMKEMESVIAVMQERYRKAGEKLKRQILSSEQAKAILSNSG